jgi:hypothetical protein
MLWNGDDIEEFEEEVEEKVEEEVEEVEEEEVEEEEKITNNYKSFIFSRLYNVMKTKKPEFKELISITINKFPELEDRTKRPYLIWNPIISYTNKQIKQLDRLISNYYDDIIYKNNDYESSKKVLNYLRSIIIGREDGEQVIIYRYSENLYGYEI